MHKDLTMTFVIFLLLMTAKKAQGSDSLLVIKNVNLIDMKIDRVQPAKDIWVKGNSILEINDHANLPLANSVIQIDGTGKYLIPGLIDAHAHISRRQIGSVMRDGLLYLKYGVTTILNLGGDKDELDYRSQMKKADSTVLVPRLYTAGWYLNEPFFSTPEEMAEQVNKQKDMGFDVIKVHGDFSTEAFTALHREAKDRNIKVIGHAPRNLGINPVLQSGQALAHAEEFLYTFFTPVRTTFFIVVFFSYLGISVVFILMVLFQAIGSLINKLRDKDVRFNFKVMWFMAATLLLFYLISHTFTPINPKFVFAGWVRPLMIILSTILFALSVMQLRSMSASFTAVTKLALMVVVSFASLYFSILAFRTTDKGINKIAGKVGKSEITVCPNLVAIHYLASSHGDEDLQKIRSQPEIKYIGDYSLDWWWPEFERDRGIKNYVAAGFWNNLKLLQKLTYQLDQQGVNLITGSDAGGVPYIIPGKSIHEELQLLNASGLSPHAALQAATINFNKFLRTQELIGDIQSGWIADMVLLDKNPLEDINHTRSITGVILRGKWLSAGDLERLVEALYL